MENNWNSFDDTSKAVIKDLVNENKKFSELIKKLQNARNSVDNRAKLNKALTNEIKK